MDSHEYYEELILKDGDLSGEERKNLKAHLEECEKCQKLEEQWKSCLNLLSKAPMVKPKADITGKWEQTLQVRTFEKEMKNQNRQIIGTIILITVLSVFSCTVLLSPEFLIPSTIQASQILLLLAGLANQFRTILSMLRLPVLIFSLGGILAVICFVVINRIGINNEENSNEGVEQS